MVARNLVPIKTTTSAVVFAAKTICLVTLAFCSVLVLGAGFAEASAIVGISIPVGSDDKPSYPLNDGVWSVSAPPFPFDINTGIGYIINPVYPTPPAPLGASEYSRQDHLYSAPHVPDPGRAIVTYEFDSSTVVDQLEVIQHQNGITQVEGFVGNSLGSLSSIGSIFGPSGDITGFSVFTEFSPYVFDFNNAIAGKFFQVIFRKTNAPTGWATYRAFPRLADGTRIPAAQVPEPTSLLLVVIAGLVGSFRSRRI